MRYFLILLLVILFVTKFEHRNKLVIQEDYIKYVEAFEKYSRQYNRPIKIADLVLDTEDDLGGSIVAQCRLFGTATPHIVVSKRLWEYSTEVEKEMIILHEISHCILKRGHLETKDVNGIPISLMYPYVLEERVYLERKEAYLKELFK